jgi:hypothetical protein
MQKHYVTSDVNAELFEAIKKMPKGALLHVHFGACVNMAKFVKHLATKHADVFKKIHYVKNADSLKEYVKKMSDDLHWNNNYKTCAMPSNPTYDITNSLTYFSNGAPHSAWETLESGNVDEIVNNCTRMTKVEDYSWYKLEECTNKYWSLIKNSVIFPLYFDFLLHEAYEDGIRIIELKTNIGGLYDQTYTTDKSGNKLYGTKWYSYEEELKVCAVIIEKNKEAIKCKLINGLHRGNIQNNPDVNNTTVNRVSSTLKTKCESFVKSDYKDYVAGIDLFGEENLSFSNLYYLKTIKQECGKINFFMHSGENIPNTKATGLSSIDVNLLTAIAVVSNDTKIRVGHGLSLIDNKELMNMYKLLNINIELCPLSNYILGYVTKMENHPGRDYIEAGLNVSINSDDPSIFGYDYVSYDWYYAILYWKLTLDQIKQVCINSIKSSGFDANIIADELNKFDKEFEKWTRTKGEKVVTKFTSEKRSQHESISHTGGGHLYSRNKKMYKMLMIN